MKPIEHAFAVVGGLTRLAELLKTTPQTVSNWRTRGVPAEYCPAIERITHGAVRCEDLRPDIDWADRVYLPKKSRKAA